MTATIPARVRNIVDSIFLEKKKTQRSDFNSMLEKAMRTQEAIEQKVKAKLAIQKLYEASPKYRYLLEQYLLSTACAKSYKIKTEIKEKYENSSDPVEFLYERLKHKKKMHYEPIEIAGMRI